MQKLRIRASRNTRPAPIVLAVRHAESIQQGVPAKQPLSGFAAKPRERSVRRRGFHDLPRRERRGSRANRLQAAIAARA